MVADLMLGDHPNCNYPTYFFFLAAFFAFFAFFFAAMVNSFRFWLENQGGCPGYSQRKTQASGRFFRFTQTGMVHAHHHTTAVTACGVMQGEEGE